MLPATRLAAGLGPLPLVFFWKTVIFHDAEYLLIFSKDFLVKIILWFFSSSRVFSVILN